MLEASRKTTISLVLLQVLMFLSVCFSAGGLHGGGSPPLAGQPRRPRPQSLHSAGLHPRLTRFSWHFPFSFFFSSLPPLVLLTFVLFVFWRAGQTNSRTMLLPLLQRFASQMRVSLYHTPDLRGLLRRLVPERFNETIGVQHIKVYLFDDSIIISGCVGSRLFTSGRIKRTHWPSSVRTTLRSTPASCRRGHYICKLPVQ